MKYYDITHDIQSYVYRPGIDSWICVVLASFRRLKQSKSLKQYLKNKLHIASFLYARSKC